MSTFRKEYRELSANEKAHVELIKDAAEQLEQLIIAIPATMAGDDSDRARMRAIARTNLEQAVMWAVKAAT
jgi:hypothetical protein